MISIIQVPFNATIIAHERMNIYAYVSIIEVSLKLIIVYLLTISGYDKLVSYAILIFIVSIIIFTVYSLYCKNKYLECRFRLVSDMTLYKSMWNFSGWMIFSNGASIGANQGINILLNIFFGPIVNAARGIAFQVSNTLTAFVTNFQTAIDPNIIKFYAADKKEIMFDLVFQNAKFAFCLMWLLVFPFLLKMEILLNYWLINVPKNAALFCRLVLIESLILSFERPFSKIVHAIGKVKMSSIVGGIAYLCVLPVSYLLLKHNYPNYIPFIIVIIARTIGLSYNLFYIHESIGLSIIQLFRQVIVPIFLVVICSLPVPLMVNYYSSDTFISLLVVSITTVLSVLVSVYFIALSKKIRIEIVNSVLKTFSLTK
jgi:O-antigen/teichoic acid export membrane protein